MILHCLQGRADGVSKVEPEVHPGGTEDIKGQEER